MKRVIYGEELKNKMYECVNLLCNAVSSTLGPTGNNVLISNSEGAPFITNDGVTIASNIGSDDSVSNAILEIVKEASLKTNEVVGDGTTTTLVLLQSIFNQGLEDIKKGYNSIKLKNDLNLLLDKVLNYLEPYKKIPTKKHLAAIAGISANDTKIGDFVSNLFFKMKSKYAIKLKEGVGVETFYKIKCGYNVEINNLSSIYFQNKKTINLANALVVVLRGYLSSLEQISNIINEGLSNQREIVIFVEDMDKTLQDELLVYYLTEGKKIFILPISEYGFHREKVEEDISVLSECSIKNIEFEKVYYSDLGNISNVEISKEEVILSIDKNRSLILIEEIKKELEEVNSDYDKDFIMNRLAKLEHGIATIYVGGQTKTETREKLMRYEDCLCALDVASYGVVAGEGIVLLDISNRLDDFSVSSKILKNSLQIPFKKIMDNLGLDSTIIKNTITQYRFEKIYNPLLDIYEDISDTKILDPIKVIEEALKNAVSIAGILLTTDYLVIDEQQINNKEII